MGLFSFLKQKLLTQPVNKQNPEDEIIDWFDQSLDRSTQVGYKRINDNEVEVVCETNYPNHSRSVAIPAKTRGYTVTSMKTMAVWGKDTVKLPDTIRVMKKKSLQGCTFKSFTLPANLEIMEHEAMAKCEKLEWIEIPSKLKQITGNPFVKCCSLTAIHTDPHHETFATIDGVLFHKSEKKLVCYPAGLLSKEYHIPQGIKCIGLSAFYGANLSTIHIPSSVEKIEGNPFVFCDKLNAFTVADDNPYFSAIDGILYDKKISRIIACPGNYFTSSHYFFNIPDSVKTIGEHAFESLKGSFRFSLPEGITDIEDYAFCQCWDLRLGPLPSTLRRIGTKALAHNRINEELCIPEGVTIISDEAFAYSRALTTLSLCCPEAVIGKNVFRGCKSLKDVRLPNGLKTISYGMFEDIEELKKITFPSSLTKIEANAFKESNIGRIHIPESVSFIGDDAFAKCPYITFLTPPGSYADQYGKRHGILTAKPDDIFWLDT